MFVYKKQLGIFPGNQGANSHNISEAHTTLLMKFTHFCRILKEWTSYDKKKFPATIRHFLSKEEIYYHEQKYTVTRS